jgi:hypothetical protein
MKTNTNNGIILLYLQINVNYIYFTIIELKMMEHYKFINIGG